MSMIEWEAFGKRVEILSDNDLGVLALEMEEFASRLSQLETQLDFTSIVLDKIPDVDGHPAFDYALALRDGRGWEQQIVNDRPNDPGSTFTISQRWRYTEIIRHGAFLAVVGKLILKYKLTMLKVTRD